MITRTGYLNKIHTYKCQIRPVIAFPQGDEERIIGLGLCYTCYLATRQLCFSSPASRWRQQGAQSSRRLVSPPCSGILQYSPHILASVHLIQCISSIVP